MVEGHFLIVEIGSFHQKTTIPPFHCPWNGDFWVTFTAVQNMPKNNILESIFVSYFTGLMKGCNATGSFDLFLHSIVIFPFS